MMETEDLLWRREIAKEKSWFSGYEMNLEEINFFLLLNVKGPVPSIRMQPARRVLTQPEIQNLNSTRIEFLGIRKNIFY